METPMQYRYRNQQLKGKKEELELKKKRLSFENDGKSYSEKRYEINVLEKQIQRAETDSRKNDIEDVKEFFQDKLEGVDFGSGPFGMEFVEMNVDEDGLTFPVYRSKTPEELQKEMTACNDSLQAQYDNKAIDKDTFEMMKEKVNSVYVHEFYKRDKKEKTQEPKKVEELPEREDDRPMDSIDLIAAQGESNRRLRIRGIQRALSDEHRKRIGYAIATGIFAVGLMVATRFSGIGENIEQVAATELKALGSFSALKDYISMLTPATILSTIGLVGSARNFRRHHANYRNVNQEFYDMMDNRPEDLGNAVKSQINSKDKKEENER